MISAFTCLTLLSGLWHWHNTSLSTLLLTFQSFKLNLLFPISNLQFLVNTKWVKLFATHPWRPDFKSPKPRKKAWSSWIHLCNPSAPTGKWQGSDRRLSGSSQANYPTIAQWMKMRLLSQSGGRQGPTSELILWCPHTCYGMGSLPFTITCVHTDAHAQIVFRSLAIVIIWEWGTSQKGDVKAWASAL